jgi:copper ion binding protein
MDSEYEVTGMTCGHCASAVSAEIGRLSGVREVRVDVGQGRVVVHSDQPLPVEAVRAAVDEAGYTLVDA